MSDIQKLLCEIKAKGGLSIERCEQLQKQLDSESWHNNAA
jgi:hypothetical protein